MRRATATAVLALALMLTGCTEEPSTPLPSTPTPSASPSSSPGEDRALVVPLRPGLADGPLEQAIGLEVERTVGDVIARIRQEEDTVASCMNDLGFDYWPKVPGPQPVVVHEGLVPGTRAFAEAYGYGAWLQGDDVGGGIGYAADVTPQEERDYLGAMSETMRAAYDEALYGPVVLVDDNGDVARGGGCAESLVEEVDPVVTAATEFVNALPTDSAFDDLNAEWAACLREKGFAYGSPDLAERAFLEEARDVHNPSADFAPTGAEILAGAERERAVALADLDCRDAVDYLTRYDAIDHELQAVYLTEHAAELGVLE